MRATHEWVKNGVTSHHFVCVCVCVGGDLIIQCHSYRHTNYNEGVHVFKKPVIKETKISYGDGRVSSVMMSLAVGLSSFLCFKHLWMRDNSVWWRTLHS